MFDPSEVWDDAALDALADHITRPQAPLTRVGLRLMLHARCPSWSEAADGSFWIFATRLRSTDQGWVLDDIEPVATMACIYEILDR